MNLKFLLSKREESRFIYYAIFQIIQLFTSLSLSLTFHKRKREKEKGDAGPVNCHLGTRQGPDIQVYRINRIPRELFSCLVDSQQPTTSRAIFYHRIREFGSVKMFRRNNYSNQGARLLSRFLFLSRNLWDPRRVTAIERSSSLFSSLFFCDRLG